MTERSGEVAGFDPRFDPAFQPGYRPPAVKPSGLEALRAAVSGQALRAVPGPRSDAPAGSADIADMEGTAGIAGSAGANSADSAVIVDSDDTAHESSDGSHRRNPFVLVLWVICVLVTLAGIGMVRWSFALTEVLQTSGTATQADWQLSYLLQQSAPLFIVLGLAVATLTVFLHAQIWNRRCG